MSVEGCNESTPIVNGEEEEEEDDEEEAQRNFRTASFNLGSSFEVINSRHRGSSASYRCVQHQYTAPHSVAAVVDN